MHTEKDMERERIANILYQMINDEPVSEPDKQELNDWSALSPHHLSMQEEVKNLRDLELNEVKPLLGHNGKAIWEKIYPHLQTAIV